MSKGLVTKSTGSWYLVLDQGGTIRCRIKGKFRTKDIATTNPVTVGDRVEYDLMEDGTGIITQIEERRNYIIRRSTRFHKEAHLLAANIDQALIMVSLKFPVSPTEFIDRFLVTAEAYQIGGCRQDPIRFRFPHVRFRVGAGPHNAGRYR